MYLPKISDNNTYNIYSSFLDFYLTIPAISLILSEENIQLLYTLFLILSLIHREHLYNIRCVGYPHVIVMLYI